MGEGAWPAEPTRGQTAWPPWTLAQREGIVASYSSSCCSVAPATQ